METIRVLILEDSEQKAALLLREMQKGGYSPIYKRIDTESEMSRALDVDPWDIIISDHLMTNFSSLAALRLLNSKGLDLPFIIVFGQAGEDAIVDAVKAGANNYVAEGNLKRLVPAIQREIQDGKVRQEHMKRKAEFTTKEEVLRRKYIRHLNMLTRFSQSLSEAKDLDTLLRKALDSFIQSLHFVAGAVYIRDATNGEFSLSAHSGVTSEFETILNDIFAGAKAVRNTKDIESQNYLKCPLDHISLTDIREYGFQSEHSHFVISVPLKSASRTIALVVLLSNGKTVLSREEKQLMKTLGSQTGVAIENAMRLQKWSQLSTIDELTELYNRRHFHKVMEIEIDRSRRYNRPLSLAILDVDRFKEYNDNFGHIGGDSVLKSLAGAMTSHLRKTDTSFRYGGDEFAVILPETDSNKAKDVIERIRLRWLYIPKTEFLGLENPIGFSAGIVEFPKNAQAQDSLLMLADSALYWSKKKGGNRSTLVSE